MIARAAMLATALLLTATTAAAQWRGEGGRDGGRGGWGDMRRFEAAQAYGGRYDADPGRARYGGGRGPGGGGGGGGYQDRGGSRAYGPGGSGARYAPGGYGRPDAAYGSPYGPAYGQGGLRRGQVVPPAYRGAYVPDPGRYHLRAAPPGYGWVGDGRNAYLTQRSTGMVLDSVPGAYEPAPAYRGGGRGRRPR